MINTPLQALVFSAKWPSRWSGLASTFLLTESRKEFQKNLEESLWSAVVSDDLDALEAAYQLKPSIPRLYVTNGKLALNDLREALHRGSLFRILPYDLAKTDVEIALQSAEEAAAQNFQRERLFTEAKLKNRQLEELTMGLEAHVKERTQTGQDAKNELEEKLSKANDIVRFIQELGSTKEFSEVLALLRKELKKFHRILEPHLGIQFPEGNQKIFSFRSQRVVEKTLEQAWPLSHRLRINEVEDSRYLANQWGRPFSKVLAFPMRLRSSEAILYFEHSFEQAEVEEFIAWIRDRIQSVSLTLDRMILEFELRRASFLWEQTFDGIDEPVAILDQDYQLLRCNRKFSQDLLMHQCHLHFNKLNKPCTGCPVQKAVEEQRSSIAQVRRQDSVFEVHAYPIRIGDAGRATTLVNHYVDITKSVDLQSRMIQNEKMAAIGHLAGHIAHELNNPLTGIRSLAQVLITQTQEQLQNDLQEVEKAAGRCQMIINNLLDFSKGSDNSDVRIFDLNEMVQKTLPLLKTAMGPMRSEVDLCDTVLNVKASPQLVQQVIFNLVNNACQAIKGKGLIQIRSYNDKHYVRLDVIDNGEGISPENLSRLFEPFFTTKSTGEGTGLGLSMSQQILKRFGGRIEVSSKWQQGSTFSILLPRVENP